MTVACFECSAPAAHDHHVIPKSIGGTKTVPLCETCHGRVHDIVYTRHSELTKAGIALARAAGVKLGPPNMVERTDDEGRRVLDPQMVAIVRAIQERYGRGDISLARLAEALNAEGVPTKEGGKWWPKTVRAALAIKL